ncbi:MAG: Cj0069 family protein [Myxococcales bacterium]|nr:Cj0069 family protein [Myxococcales bacterium]
MTAEQVGRLAIVWRGDVQARKAASASKGRMGPLFDALAEAGVTAEAAVFCEELREEFRQQLLAVDGALVFVNPVDAAGDRSVLDAVLYEVAEAGVWVSTHPETILKMGTKEVLYRTRQLGWGSDCDLYGSAEAMRERLPGRLADGQTRVLKQYRGNGGLGVYRVALKSPGDASTTAQVPVITQHARFGSEPRELPLGQFMTKMEKHFVGDGRLIDQAFQPRLAEGMTRCYMVGAEVAGFSHQLIKALLPPPPEGATSEQARPGPRIMHGADASEFQRLRGLLESEWIPAMQQLLDISGARLPVLWDADFLLGPKDAKGQDSHVLCEINVSAVFPFPDQALPRLAAAVASALRGSRAARA